MRFGDGDDWLKAGPLRSSPTGHPDRHVVYAGTLWTGRTATVRRERSRLSGLLTLTPEQIASAFAIGHRLGWQMVAHVTGDAGVDAVLDAIEAAQRGSPGDRRDTLD